MVATFVLLVAGLVGAVVMAVKVFRALVSGDKRFLSAC
jgi:hypothetical protein